MMKTLALARRLANIWLETLAGARVYCEQISIGLAQGRSDRAMSGIRRADRSSEETAGSLQFRRFALTLCWTGQFATG